ASRTSIRSHSSSASRSSPWPFSWSRSNTRFVTRRRPRMGEEDTWFNLLPGLRNIEEYFRPHLERKALTGMFPTHFSFSHVFALGLVLLFVTIGAFAFRAAAARGGEAWLVPPRKFNLRNLFEMFTDAIFSLASGVMGEKNARRFLPLL